MNIRICNVNGFICDADLENALAYCNGFYDCIILLSTREINGDIAVSKDNIPDFKIRYDSFINKLKKHANKLILVLDQWYEQYASVFESNNINDVLYINSFLYTTYRRIIVHTESKIIQEYKLNKINQFLFLMNKTATIHRIGLLYKLRQRNLLTSSNYSFVMPNDFTQTESKKTLDCMLEAEDGQPLSQSQFDNFYIENKCILDLEYNEPILNKINYTHYTGIPYNEKLFLDCNFQLISETHFDLTVWMTEKTWLSIVNKRPFIIAAYPGFLNKLKQMGFKTFEEYLKVPNYDTVINNIDRLNAIVENVEDWLHNIDRHFEAIKRDVDHNYKLFLLISRQEEVKINKLIEKHNLPCSVDMITSHDNHNDEIKFNRKQ
jgi:hypothetical protein